MKEGTGCGLFLFLPTPASFAPYRRDGWKNEPASREGYVLRRSCERFDTAAVIEQGG
jgi:hypothetical protein